MESLVLSLWVVFLEASEVLAPCPKSHSDFVSPWFASPAVQTSARLPRRGGALRTYGKALTLCSRLCLLLRYDRAGSGTLSDALLMQRLQTTL